MKFRYCAFPAALATAALALVGCSQGADSTAKSTSSASSGEVSVVASFYPLAYLAEQIGGDHVSITNLTPSGEAHDAELSASQVDDVANADVVIYEKEFQPSVDEAIEQAKPARVVDVADHVDLVPIEQHESGVDEADGDADEHDEADHDHADHDHGDHDHAGHHHHGSKDPHFWLDPHLYADAIDPIVESLSQADKAHAADYKANGEKLRESLTKLDDKYAKTLTNCQTPTIVVAHEAYGYMADQYHFTQVGVSGINPEQETSAKRLEAVAKVAQDNHVSVLFSESALNAKDSQTLAKQLGITTKVLDPLETQTDSSKDYIAVMESNLASLSEAMQCQPAK
ncbi:zinc ABC transporter substrate-binding protein [Nanchangia anserum]|uniref:Zinc ABC transporter substrate-binding protein n=1 Tax=Nanchangia anserum TaxID=2692125 RepID=A0A8I0GBF2_9ACTO|nr:metal ABC transporter substrate-binding protein [Nanchangia anserum]MBD3689080.1 zinc ABC transporter substrate-binding protein [Nanchangia anserum]QOX81319.1 zinc ABC transporter substrate-binding protein [Nanchangia anserum]